MTQRAYFFLLLTTLFWGGNAIAGKLAIGQISPMLLTTTRWSMALAIMLVIALPQLRRDRATIRAHWKLLAAYGAVGFTAFNVALYSALEYTSAINVVIEQAGMPVVIFIANFLIFRIRATSHQIAGFFMTLVGVLLVASGGNLGHLIDLTLNRGDVIMLIGVLFYGGYTIALRYKPPLHWKSMMTVLAFFALLTSLPFSAWELAVGRMVVPGAEGLAIAAYTAIFPSLVSQVLFIKGNELIGSNRAGLFINLVPIFGTLMSVFLLGEALHLYHIIALALVMGGIWMAERVKRAKTD